MRRDWDMSAFGHRLGPEPPPPADDELCTTAPVTKGQVYRWLGADVLIDEVDLDGKGARITIRQDGCRARQKWQPLPFPPEAVLVTTSAQRERTHWDECWRVHDDCALAQAEGLLVSQLATSPAQPTAVISRLDVIRGAIADHAAQGCSAAMGECYAAGRAREVLGGEWP